LNTDVYFEKEFNRRIYECALNGFKLKFLKAICAYGMIESHSGMFAVSIHVRMKILRYG